MRTDLSPPRWPAWLLERLMPSRVLESALGDLAEEYAIRAQAVPALAAGYWYWMQIGCSIPVLFGIALKHAGMLRTLAVAVAADLGAGVAEDSTNRAIGLIPLSDPARAVAGVFVGVTAVACAGYVAARIRPPAAPVLAALVFAIVVTLMIVAGDGVPLWYQLAFLVFAPVASIAGGVVAVRRARPTIS
jgi:hypothetical protein